MANGMDDWQREYNARLALGNEPGSPAALQAAIERLRAALLDVPVYSENNPWRTKHKDLLRSIGAWMGSAVDPGGRILETDLARKQKPTDQ